MDAGTAVIASIVLIALSVGGIAFVLLYPMFQKGSVANRRFNRVAGTAITSRSVSFREPDSKDQRRKAVQESLKQLERTEKQRRRLTIRMMLLQAGIQVTVQRFWLTAALIGTVLAVMVYAMGSGLIVSVVAGLVGTFGLPRWLLSGARKRRQTIFILQLPDAVDVMVRGLKAGLPVNDAMLLISSEMPPPLGPEFREIVEGQKLGIPIDQGLERLYERLPLAEVNFLSIVIGIQSKTGGNLSETLSNLSRVLRDRKKMRSKIKSVSQEAKSSAAIIGSLPPLVMLFLYFTRPEYMSALWLEPIGQVLLGASAIWMLVGILVMRKMIHFDF